MAVAPEVDTGGATRTLEADGGASSQAGAALEPAVTSETGGGEAAVKSDAGRSSESGGKSKAGGKAKKGKAQKSSAGGSPSGDGGDSHALTLAAHPRAARRVAEAKAWGALAGFMLGGYLSLPTHTAVDAALRALAAGAFCYVAVWGAALFLWRRLVVAELREAEQQLLASKLAGRQGAERQALPVGESDGTGAAP